MGRSAGALGRIPAEWEPMQAIWMGAEASRPEWMDFTATLARILLPHVRVKLLVATEDEATKALEGLRQRDVRADTILVVVHPHGQFFVRDRLQFMIDNNERTGVVGLGWNTYGLADWCTSHRFADDPESARHYADLATVDDGGLADLVAAQLGGAVAPADLVMEGGGIEVNGKGVLLVTESVAFQRNRGRDRADLERALLALPGITKVIWLADGLAEDPHMKGTITDDYVAFGAGGHVDEFVRFAGPRTILLAWVEDADVDEHPLNAINRERMEDSYQRLSHSTDEEGRPFRIVKVPLPRVIEREDVLPERAQDELAFSAATFPTREARKAGDRVARVASASYLNYLVVNSQLVLPTYVEDGTPPAVEERVHEIFSDVFPGRTRHRIRATELNWGGGGIHCATNSEPNSTTLRVPAIGRRA